MKVLVRDIIQKLQQPGITFADVRFTSDDNRSIYFQKGELRSVFTSSEAMSLGVRVLIDGCWGFAGTRSLDRASVDKTIQAAIRNARHGSKFRHQPVVWNTLEAIQQSYFYQPLEDPFLMDIQEMIAYFAKIAKSLVGNPQIVNSDVRAAFSRQYKVYANTEGTFTDSLVYDALPTMSVLASNGKNAYSRTFPGHMSAERGGFEVIRNLNLEMNAQRIVQEAIALLTAPAITEERADIIIGGGHLALQLHESVGHATEADRIFGMEISYAGKTFVKPSMLGNFRYGSEQVTIYSDSTDPKGLGYHIVDDDGVPGTKLDIIHKGILMNQQTSRELAPLLGLSPSSNNTATHGDNIPLIRMSNLCLAPGSGSLADLIRNTERGYFIDHTKCWSIDDNRYNFQFTTEIGWRIVDGELREIVKEPTYFGITPEFWGSCDHVCGVEDWKYHGTFHCGKGEPGQVMHLSHGVAPARFRNVVVNIKA
jgi:TldD protein